MAPKTIPSFSTDKLDALLDRFGIDILIVTSKHNIRYLLGGYYHFQFEFMDAIGTSRHLPIVIYVRGRPTQAAYVANRNEKDSIENERASRLWIPNIAAGSSGTRDAAILAAQYIQRLPTNHRRIGVESAFLPADAADELRQALPERTFVEAMRPLELLRAVKTADELTILKRASELVVQAMRDVIDATRPGHTKRDIVERLRAAEMARGLTFEYALVTIGSSHNRAPSDQVFEPGNVISLDSGGNYRGYIGDLCRMAIHGKPDSELSDLLSEVDSIQKAARRVVAAGVRGGDIYAAAEPALRQCSQADELRFVAHGMGIVSHEAPRLTDSGPIPYPADDADNPLQSGMVLSIETTMIHPRRGFIKLEDTLAVMPHGYEAYGDDARGWNVIPE